MGDKDNSKAEEGQLFEGQVVTVSNENCTKWIQANADKFEFFALPYGNGSTFGELKHEINKEILCSRGIVQADGVISHACAGDSGGPLYINQQKNDKNEITDQTLAGILAGSGRENCGTLDIYNYWIRVSEHLDWIKCVKKNAEENKTTRNIQRACNRFVKQFNEM